jgi:Bacterial dnaA protein helix-turn-helix
MLLDAAKARQSKAWFRRPEDQRAEERLATLINLGPIVRHAASVDPGNEFPESCPQAEELVLDPPALRETIQTIRRLVCEHFHLAEMRDPGLTVRSNRRAYVLPRQLAMYIVRQLTGASLVEIGREFGGRHHTTVLHSINKVEEMRRSDEALNRTISQLMDAFAAQT